MIAARKRKASLGRVAKVAPARQRRLSPMGCQISFGVLVGWNAKGPLVEMDGNLRDPVQARISGSGSLVRPGPPAILNQEVVLLVDPRPGRPPVVLGFLEPLDVRVPPAELEARVDGRRVEIDGRDEIVLRCGEASITLRRNGRVVIRGLQVETRAAGLNRIKGGSVSIN